MMEHFQLEELAYPTPVRLIQKIEFSKHRTVGSHEESDSHLPKRAVKPHFRRGERQISCSIPILKIGSKNGDKFCRKGFMFQRIPCYGHQRFFFRLPNPICCEADAALYIAAAGVIALGDRRVQPPFSKQCP